MCEEKWNKNKVIKKKEKKMFENVDIHTCTHIHTYGRQRPTYPISSPLSLRLRWAKNKKCM